MYPMGYNDLMIEIRKTEAYARWLNGLRDVRARARILVRVERLAAGNPGDVSPDFSPAFEAKPPRWFCMRGLRLKTPQTYPLAIRRGG